MLANCLRLLPGFSPRIINNSSEAFCIPAALPRYRNASCSDIEGTDQIET